MTQKKAEFPPSENGPEQKDKYHRERRYALSYLNKNDWATYVWSEKAIKSFIAGMLRERKTLAEERALHEARRLTMINMGLQHADKEIAFKEKIKELEGRLSLYERRLINSDLLHGMIVNELMRRLLKIAGSPFRLTFGIWHRAQARLALRFIENTDSNSGERAPEGEKEKR